MKEAGDTYRPVVGQSTAAEDVVNLHDPRLRVLPQGGAAEGEGGICGRG